MEDPGTPLSRQSRGTSRTSSPIIFSLPQSITNTRDLGKLHLSIDSAVIVMEISI